MISAVERITVAVIVAASFDQAVLAPLAGELRKELVRVGLVRPMRYDSWAEA